jgi:hypothetical protein
VIVGIVGSEEAKFTPLGRGRAYEVIIDLLTRDGVTEVCSGACHLGGIDKMAIQIGLEIGLGIKEFPPERLTWEYYRQRNIEIANYSTEVHCITVDKLPETFRGMRFPLCYHCETDDHVKSGGCWTMKYAIKHGKHGQLHIVRNFE